MLTTEWSQFESFEGHQIGKDSQQNVVNVMILLCTDLKSFIYIRKLSYYLVYSSCYYSSSFLHAPSWLLVQKLTFGFRNLNPQWFRLGRTTVTSLLDFVRNVMLSYKNCTLRILHLVVLNFSLMSYCTARYQQYSVEVLVRIVRCGLKKSFCGVFQTCSKQLPGARPKRCLPLSALVKFQCT